MDDTGSFELAELELARYKALSLNVGVGHDRVAAAVGLDVTSNIEVQGIASALFEDLKKFEFKPHIGIGIAAKW